MIRELIMLFLIGFVAFSAMEYPEETKEHAIEYTDLTLHLAEEGLEKTKSTIENIRAESVRKKG